MFVKGVREVKRKVLVIAVALIAVAMLATPLVSTAQACRWIKPASMTLEGTYSVTPDALNYVTQYDCPETGKTIMIWKGLPSYWTGDVTSDSTYTGIWIITDFMQPTMELKMYGIQVFKNAVVNGIGTGDLVTYSEDATMRILWGTGDLRGIKGTGEVTTINHIDYDYILEVKIGL